MRNAYVQRTIVIFPHHVMADLKILSRPAPDKAPETDSGQFDDREYSSKAVFLPSLAPGTAELANLAN